MFAPKVHESAAPLRGDRRAALEVARTALVALGFEIVADSEVALSARGPGMQSNREPALLGASELHLHVSRTEVEARAVLGGVARMKAFVHLFPAGLGLTLGLAASVFGDSPWWAGPAWALPWLFLAPWMARSIERRTEGAIDRLVSGMAGTPARPA